MSSTAGKVIHCKAAIAWEPNKPLSIETIEVAPPKKFEVRIKVVASGVCHSDVSFLNGTIPIKFFPVILGHEGAGIVESVGEGVTKFQPGDHVILLYIPQCFECKGCKHPNTNFCEKFNIFDDGLMPDKTTRFSCNGKRIHHLVSSFSEYTVMTEWSLAKVNKEAPLEKICLIGCGVSTGYGAALNTAKVTPGSVCGVWGLGGIGLSAVMGCRAAGASKIYGIDINPDKFELAGKFGCTDFINPKEYDEKKFKEIIINETGGGFDYSIECIGNPNTVKLAFETSHKNWGVTAIIGLCPVGSLLQIPPIEFFYGKCLTGSCFGGWKSVEAVPKLVEDYLNKKIMLDEFITKKMKLEDINLAFELLNRGEGIRSVMEY